MPSELSSPKKKRAYIAGRFSLELDGADTDVFVASVDGGNFKSEAIGEQVGGENLVTRYPGRQKFEDITLQVGTTRGKTFWEWVKHSIDGNPSRRNGAIVTRDNDHFVRARRTFIDALISEVQFPELDAKAKGPKLITVKIAPEQLRYEEKIEPPPERQEQKKDLHEPQKMAVPANFSLTVEGMDREVTRQVVKIDAFSVKQNIIDNPVGGMLYARREAGRLEFPTLSVQVPQTYAKPWMDWWQEFVGRGNHVQKNERTAAISYLDSTLGKTLLTLHLYGVGITGVSFDKHEGGSDSIRTAKVDLYVESIVLEMK
jgi:phage tail-like protein